MESLNLNALAGSLPTSNLANAEKELLNNFRGNILNPPTCRRLTFFGGKRRPSALPTSIAPHARLPSAHTTRDTLRHAPTCSR